MRTRRTRLAAVALAAAALGSWPAAAWPRAAAPAPDLDRELGLLEQRAAAAERTEAAADETRAARAQRHFEEGERQYALGDWQHAGLLLTDAVDEPEWSGSRDRARALLLLADALRRHGLCGAARVRYADYLARPDATDRGQAISGALDCAVKERRHADVDGLLADAARTFRADAPQDVRYLAAKAAYQRADLAPAERTARAVAAFEQVGPPFQLQAWYFQGVLAIEQENLHGALQWFETCARSQPAGDRDVEVRELCLLALGRVHAQMGNSSDALAWYGSLPWDSARFSEAMYEMALAYVRAKQWEDALRMTSFIAELAPDSPFAPEATVLRGHLLLRLGRYSEATEAYNVVINTYAPVRDEIDAILATGEDPIHYFDELIGRQAAAFDVATVLPPVAVRWATTNREVAVALDLVRAVDGARDDVKEGRDLADRVDALLRRGGGLDAFPALQRAYAQSQALENAAARLDGAFVAAAAAVVERTVPPERRGELTRASAARAAVEARFAKLPRTPQDVEDRLARIRGRIGAVERSAYQLRFAIEGGTQAVGGCETYLDQHRDEIVSDAESRQEYSEELRKHRGVVEGYAAELAALRLELSKVRDVAGGVDAMAEESRLREEYLAAVERERQAVEAVWSLVPLLERGALEKADRGREKLARVRERAAAVRATLAADAAKRADAMRARVETERGVLEAHAFALEAVRRGSKDVLGGIAVRSIAEVRGQFYRLVLKADIGIVDVAWSRKRQRLEKIQTLAVQKDAEVEQLDRDYRSMLREVD